ncbi:MAG: hypothetical protein A2298_02425 [Gammaproteobacteria bacterium RIFOXYB2_FULL_38_6]|nr:MAG: hypothetical protein A2298_02425 [Gammaproteobacteria bacterium RIFOXYB2_FULL_38_6]
MGLVLVSRAVDFFRAAKNRKNQSRRIIHSKNALAINIAVLNFNFKENIFLKQFLKQKIRIKVFPSSYFIYGKWLFFNSSIFPAILKIY